MIFCSSSMGVMTKRVLMGLPKYYINSGNALWIVGLFEFISPLSGIDVLVSGINICISGINFGIVGTSLGVALQLLTCRVAVSFVPSSPIHGLVSRQR